MTTVKMSINSKKKDQGFTNIRIRDETREELRAIGSYGENMDDIVRKCLAAYKAITISGGRVVNKIVVEEPIKEQTQMQQQYQQPQPRSQQQTHRQNQQSDTSAFDNDEVSIKDKLRSELTIFVPGLKFPIKRDGLIRFAESFRNEFQNKYHKTSDSIEHPLYIIKKLPHDLVYKDKERLSYDLITIASKDNKLYKNHYISDGTPKYAGCNLESFDSPNINNEEFKSHVMEVLNKVADAELESKKEALEKWPARTKDELRYKKRELEKLRSH